MRKGFENEGMRDFSDNNGRHDAGLEIQEKILDLQNKIKNKGLAKGEKSRLLGELRKMQEKADFQGIAKNPVLDSSDKIEKKEPKNIWDDVKRQADRIYNKKGKFVAQEAEAKKRKKKMKSIQFLLKIINLK